MESLLNFYTSTFGLSREHAQSLTVRFEKLKIRKKTVLIHSGTTENYLYFIAEGVVRFFIHKPHATEPPKEITFSFGLKNMFCCAYDSFITRLPCQYNAETLENSILYRIHYNDIQYLYNNTEIGNYLGRIAAEELYVLKSKREISLLTCSAKERYLNLLATYPHYILEIPLKYIASYLGITPQALSRIRKEIN